MNDFTYNPALQPKVDALYTSVMKTGEKFHAAFVELGIGDADTARQYLYRTVSKEFGVPLKESQRGGMTLEDPKTTKGARATAFTSAKNRVNYVLSVVFPKTDEFKKGVKSTDWLKKAKAAWEQMDATERRAFKKFIG